MSDILQQAEKIAGEDRSRDYGHPKANHDRIATLWNAWFTVRGYSNRVTASDVATLMILLKLARMGHAYKQDSVVDIAGYAKCLDMIHAAESANRNGLNWPPDGTVSVHIPTAIEKAMADFEKSHVATVTPFNDVPKGTVVDPWNCGNCKRGCDYTKQWNRFGVAVCDQCWNESIKVGPNVSAEQIQAAIAEQ